MCYYNNLSYYFNLLPPHEQIKEINNLVMYFSKYAHRRHEYRMNYAKIVSLKNIKKEILSRMYACEYVLLR